MRKSFWIIPLLFVAISAPSASADSFTFTVTGALSGSGTLTTDPLSGGSYVITDISGTFNGGTITGLIASGAFAGNDNLLFPTSPQLDLGGVSFTLAGGVRWNIGFNSACPCYGADSLSTGIVQPLTFAAVATPEPSSVALMLLGLGFVFVIRKRIGQGLPLAT